MPKKEKNNNGETLSRKGNVIITLLIWGLIILDILSVFLLNKNDSLSYIFTLIVSSGILGLTTYKQIKKERDGKALKVSKAVIFSFILLIVVDGVAIGIQKYKDDIFPPVQEEYYDFSEINIGETDIFFFQENNQIEFEEKLKKSLLHVQKVPVHSSDYLNVLNGYSDLAPIAEKAEEMMLDIIHSDTIDEVDEMTRESIRLSVNTNRQSMDEVEHTVSNRNSLFENALSMANFRFTKAFQEDYCIAACYAWGRLYTSVGSGAFCKNDIDKIIRVYNNMLDSGEFSENKNAVNLVIDTLELLKSDDDFIQDLTEYSHLL